MPGQPTTAGAVKMLDAVTGRATVTGIPTYLALFTAAPTDAGGGTEITTAGTDGYYREPVTWDEPAGDPTVTENQGGLEFGPFTADLPTATHCALMSAATGGTVLYWWDLDVAKDPAAGDLITVAAGALTMSAD